MNTIWSKDTESKGQYIKLKQASLEWVSYELPSTSHSGGGSHEFPHRDFFTGSPLYNQVLSEFGESVADQIIYAIKNIGSIDRTIQKGSYGALLLDWLSTIPDDSAIEEPWVKSHKRSENTYGHESALKTIGIEVEKRESDYIIKDAVFKVELFVMHADNSIDFAANEKGIRVFCSRTEFFMVKAISGGFKVFKPFEHWREKWRIQNSEVGFMYMYPEYVILRFNVDRIYSERGDYLLKINFDGNVIGKKVLSPYSVD